MTSDLKSSYMWVHVKKQQKAWFKLTDVGAQVSLKYGSKF